MLKWRNHMQHMKKMNRKRCFIITGFLKVKQKVPLGVGKEDMIEMVVIEEIIVTAIIIIIIIISILEEIEVNGEAEVRAFAVRGNARNIKKILLTDLVILADVLFVSQFYTGQKTVHIQNLMKQQ